MNYIVWRYTASINWAYWIIALPLLAAETYSYLDAWLFGVGTWRLRVRGEPETPAPGVTADVFVTCYNEPVDLVRQTVSAAVAVRYPHKTYVLDDGGSADMQAMAQEEGAGYMARGQEWQGHQRHAKAGNLNNALLQTDGEFLLVLDADQVPAADILDRTLGYFRDPKMAFVQTPQRFYNVPDGDPLGCEAPLFYGPIQQGKDGWNAAFFCGSNGVLRREALMQLGVRRYVQELEQRVHRALKTANGALKRAWRKLSVAQQPGVWRFLRRPTPQDRETEEVRWALAELREAVAAARTGLRKKEPVQEVTWKFQRRAEAVSRQVISRQLEAIRVELLDGAELDGFQTTNDLSLVVDDDLAMSRLAGRDLSPLAAIEVVRILLAAVDLDRADEAQPVMPMSTISVTEDMATAMRLHAMGWRSAYHDEILAAGLAPEDFRSSLQQRLRWCQGTLQVLLRENPLFVGGLSLAQRLMYFGTMWTYLSGPFTVVYLASPILYMLFGWLPLRAYSPDFFWHLLPFLAANQVLLFVVGWKRSTWRGQQYSLALFPLWIKAAVSAIGSVYFGRKLGFVVTPKTRQANSFQLRLVGFQAMIVVLLVGSSLFGVSELFLGFRSDGLAVSLNLLWVCYDLACLGVLFKAARFRPNAEGMLDPQAELTRWRSRPRRCLLNRTTVSIKRRGACRR